MNEQKQPTVSYPYPRALPVSQLVYRLTCSLCGGGLTAEAGHRLVCACGQEYSSLTPPANYMEVLP